MKLKDDQAELAYGAGQIDPVSIHIGGAIILAIWLHQKLLYLFYLLTLQTTQHQWFYFNFQHNKIIYLLQ